MDKSRVLESQKTGKKFIILKLSDLVKYDMTKVRQKVAKQFRNDGAAQKLAMKNFNAEGYKTLSFLAFGEQLTLPFSKIHCGTVVAILNPRLMKQQQKQPQTQQVKGPLDAVVTRTPEPDTSFSIECEEALIKIGVAKDFNICSGQSIHPTT